MVVKTKNSSGRSEKFQFFLTIDFPSIDLVLCSGESFRSYFIIERRQLIVRIVSIPKWVLIYFCLKVFVFVLTK